MGIVLYHGSTVTIRKPDSLLGRTDVDFGQGFYLTSVYSQAARWAVRRRLIKPARQGVVNTYAFTERPVLKIKRFDGYSEEWLDFVIANRTSRDVPVPCEFDIIIGNVANDDVIHAIDRYLELASRNQATPLAKRALLEELTFSKPNDQYCFKTLAALDCLKWLRDEAVDG
jgi:hypothetical protein